MGGGGAAEAWICMDGLGRTEVTISSAEEVLAVKQVPLRTLLSCTTSFTTIYHPTEAKSDGSLLKPVRNHIPGWIPYTVYAFALCL